MRDLLDKIASSLRKTEKNIYTKTDENRAIKQALLDRVGWSVSIGYIANIRRGVQTESVGDGLRYSIEQLHKIVCSSKPSPKPDFRLRPVQSMLTGDQVRFVQSVLTTEERGLVLVDAAKLKSEYIALIKEMKDKEGMK